MNNDDKLKVIYDHVSSECRLYETYDEFSKEISQLPHNEKVLKQYNILIERIEHAQKILKDVMDNLKTNEFNDSKRHKTESA